MGYATLQVLARLCLLSLVGSATLASEPGPASFGDEFLVTSWGTEHGLPENSATAISQTPDGYLWFGTFNGLVRFNGSEFTVFTPANTPALGNPSIVGLHCDRTGRLWVATYRGLVRLDGTQWQTLLQTDGESSNFIRSFAERENGDLLLTTFGGRVMEVSGQEVREMPSPPGARNQGYFAGVDERGRWWVVQNHFVGFFQDGHWEAALPEPQVSAEAIGCTSARRGGLWILLGTDLHRMFAGKEVERLKLSEIPGGVWSLSEDRQGNIWIATHDHGICLVDHSGALLRWNARAGGSDHGRCVFQDREDNLWVGTAGDGLSRFTNRRFRRYSLDAEGKGLVVQSVSPESSGGLWVATYGHGLFHLSDTGATNVGWPPPKESTAYLQSVLEDRAGRLWVGTFGNSLWVRDHGQTRHVAPEEIGGDNALALFEDSRGRIWISGGRGIAMFDGTRFQKFGGEQGSATVGVYCFGEDASGAIWISNGSGVFRLTETRSFAEVKDRLGQPVSGCGCLRASTEGALWLGTSSRGLLLWERGKILGDEERSDLSPIPILGLIEDQQGYLWMPSQRALLRARQADLRSALESGTPRIRYQVFDRSDGLPRANFTANRQPNCVRDPRGRLWFATTKDIIMADPSALRLNDKLPPVQVEEVSFFHPTTRAQAPQNPRRTTETRLRPPFARRVSLPAGSHRVAFRYVALSLSAPEKIRYQVKLEGHDQDWQDMGDDRSVSYHELEPREFVFHVRAANGDGLWNETGATLAFAVEPFLWERLWFKRGMFLVLLTLCGLIVWWRLHRRFRLQLAEVDRDRRIQEQFSRSLIDSQEAERQRIAADLHDSLGQDLMLIKNRLLLLTAGFGKTADLPTQVAEISRTTSRAIAEVRAISAALRPPDLEHIGLTRAIQWIVEKVGEVSQTKFSTELDFIDGLLQSDQEIQLYRIIQEGLNNVVKHAHAKQAILEVKREPHELRVSLYDDGQGFEPLRPRTSAGTASGFGLSSMTERAKVLGGLLDLQSTPGRGTRLTITIALPTRPGQT
jgi:signal transduction histidine kinase/ligand-binding sensor domain-containing protein